MRLIRGKNINLRLALVSDAGFVCELRAQVNKTQFLSKVSNDVEAQKIWLSEYKKREKLGLEYYFVIEDIYEKRLGLVRVYDLQQESFCWGSWLIKDDAPTTTAIESVLLVYGFGKLGYKISHFDVRKGNERVIAFHKRFGATVIKEDDDSFYFTYSLMSYLKTQQKYRRYLK